MARLAAHNGSHNQERITYKVLSGKDWTELVLTGPELTFEI